MLTLMPVFTQPAQAQGNTAPDIRAAINAWWTNSYRDTWINQGRNGTELLATDAGSVVTVTGDPRMYGGLPILHRILPVNILALRVSSTATIRWQASVTFEAGGPENPLIALQDVNGTFIMESGEIVTIDATAYGVPIELWSPLNLRIEGGTIRSGRDYTIISRGNTTVSGGTVAHAGAKSAIFFHHNLTVTGGTVSATGAGGTAIEAFGNNAVALVRNPNFVQASGGASKYKVTGANAIIIETTAGTSFPVNSSTGITVTGAGATAFWAVEGGVNGIRYTRGTNTGFIPTPGVTFTTSATITINTHPAANTSVTAGSITGSLTVAASGASGLNYQWYQRLGSTPNPSTDTRVGTNSASFTIPTGLTDGTYRYYCVVSASGAHSVTSNVANVYVGLTSVTTITTHPVPVTSVIAGNIAGSLGVAASNSQNYAVSYLWYSNTTNSNSGGTGISGATYASFTIPKTLAQGTYYYFCEVTAPGAPAVRTNVAEVRVLAAGTQITVIDLSEAKYADANVIASEINSALTLAASATNKTVTVIGTRDIGIGVSVPVITIPTGTTLKWQAELSGGSVHAGAYPHGSLLAVAGGTGTGARGEFEMAGGSITNTLSGNQPSNAMTLGGTAANSAVNLTVSGGTISGNESGVVVRLGSEIRVSGTGRVETRSDGRAILLVGDGNKVTISGGSVGGTVAGSVAIGNPSSNNNQTILVSGGTVETRGTTIDLQGTGHSIGISNGTVSSANQPVISFGQSNNSVTVSGGTVSTGSSSPAISMGGATGCTLAVSGGSVLNTGSGSAIGWTSTAQNLNITISGGTVRNNSAANPTVVMGNTATTRLDITGGIIENQNAGGNEIQSSGLVFAYGATTDYRSNIENNGVFVAWNKDAGRTAYYTGTTDDLTFVPSTATVTWQPTNRISYANNTNNGNITPGVTVGPAPIVNAAAPLIQVQPRDVEYVQNAPSSPLFVAAESTDGGALSFQWYSNTANNNTGGTAISGATNFNYTPPTTALGTTFYYVVITNTNTAVNGTQTASLASSAAKVVVATSLDGATVTISGTYTYTGLLQTPTAANVSVELGGSALTHPTNYTFAVTGGGTNAGTATVTITGTGAYTGTLTETFTIDPAPLTVTNFAITKPYDGNSNVTGFGTPAFSNLQNGETATVDASQVAATYDNANAGTGKAITFSGNFGMTGGTATATNYSITQPTGITGAITKINFPSTPVTIAETVYANQATTDKKLDLSSVTGFTLPLGWTLPANATVSGTNQALILSNSVADSVLTYSTSSQTAGATATMTLNVQSTNYNDFNIEITVTAQAKADVSANITFNPGSATYTGDELDSAAATISGITAGANPTWTYTYAIPTDGTETGNESLGVGGKPVNAGNYLVTAVYEDGANRGEATQAFAVSKALPGGAPIITAIASAGKTLADVPLTGTFTNPHNNASIAGTLAWVLPPGTVVTQGTTYQWTFTPTGADAANYSEKNGGVVLWPMAGGANVAIPVMGPAGLVLLVLMLAGMAARRRV